MASGTSGLYLWLFNPTAYGARRALKQASKIYREPEAAAKTFGAAAAQKQKAYWGTILELGLKNAIAEQLLRDAKSASATANIVAEEAAETFSALSEELNFLDVTRARLGFHSVAYGRLLQPSGQKIFGGANEKA